MKITKSQLKQIIKEELLKLQEYGGRPYDPTVAGDFERARDNITGDAPPGPPMDLGPPPGHVRVFMVHYRGHNADQYVGIFSSEENAQEAIVDDIKDTEYILEPGDPDIHQLRHEPKVEDYDITPMLLGRDLKHPRTGQKLTLDRGRKDDPHRHLVREKKRIK